MLSRETKVIRCLKKLLYEARMQEWHFLVQKNSNLQTCKTIPAENRRE